MSIDSQQKRASVASIGSFFVGPSVVIDGTISAADRAHVGYGYPGIPAGAQVVIVVTDPERIISVGYRDRIFAMTCGLVCRTFTQRN